LHFLRRHQLPAAITNGTQTTSGNSVYLSMSHAESTFFIVLRSFYAKVMPGHSRCMCINHLPLMNISF